MASRKLNRPRLLALAGMACAMAGAGVIGQGGLLPGTAYAADKAAGPLTFVNEASQRLNVMQDSAYRFDALFVDFNSDGCVDAFIVSHSDWGQTSRLWNNRCDGSGTFQYVSPGEGNYYIAGEPLISGWVTRLDFNGDGKQDFWGRHGAATNARYRNGSTDGAFIPRFAAKETGCDDYCAFADITGSGNLEVITNTRRVLNMSGTQLRAASGNRAYLAVGDVTGDGWPDIVQPATGGYWRNDQGTLNWVAVPAFAGGAFMQVLLADFDNDGHLDLFYLDGAQFSASSRAYLFRNNGSGGFTDVSTASGLSGIRSSDYGNVTVGDFDNDGWQDLLVSGISDSVRLFRNNGNLTFTQASQDFGPAAGQGSSGWQSASPRADVGDFDNDGRLDIIKTQFQSNIGLWRNTTNTDGNRWMKVRVRGGGGNSDGVGASVRWYRPGTNQLVAHMPVLAGEQHPQTHLHTGLGTNATVDLEVRFPNGGPTHRFNGLASNQQVIVYRNGCIQTNWQPGNGWALAPPSNCSFSNPTRRRNGSAPLVPPAQGGATQAPSMAAAAPQPAAAASRVAGDTPAASGAMTPQERLQRTSVRITPTALVLWRNFRQWFEGLLARDLRSER